MDVHDYMACIHTSRSPPKAVKNDFERQGIIQVEDKYKINAMKREPRNLQLNRYVYCDRV